MVQRSRSMEVTITSSNNRTKGLEIMTSDERKMTTGSTNIETKLASWESKLSSYNLAFSFLSISLHSLCSIQFRQTAHIAAVTPTGGQTRQRPAHHCGLLF
jgi:hypothetical protein